MRATAGMRSINSGGCEGWPRPRHSNPWGFVTEMEGFFCLSRYLFSTFDVFLISQRVWRHVTERDGDTMVMLDTIVSFVCEKRTVQKGQDFLSNPPSLPLPRLTPWRPCSLPYPLTPPVLSPCTPLPALFRCSFHLWHRTPSAEQNKAERDVGAPLWVSSGGFAQSPLFPPSLRMK